MASRRSKFPNLANEYSIPVRRVPDKKETYEESLTQLGVPMQLEAGLLITDEDNIKIYGNDEQESIIALSEDMKKNGFKGAILAYPIIDEYGDKKYQIESGHRRFKAAKLAGITTIPVIITDKPQTDSERKIRLISMNLHSRESLKPTVMAKVIETLFEANKSELERNGLESNYNAVKTVVAAQVELSTKSVEKYRQISKMTQRLQNLADEGIAWSALINASSLPEDKQQYIAYKIEEELERVGRDNITRVWVVKLIDNIKKSEPDEEEEQVPKIKVKRRNGSKILTRCVNDMTDIINGNAVFKDTQKQEALDNLQKIKELVDKKIAELSKD